MSAISTGTPTAESCSAMFCSVLVLPEPVVPATRPCRLSMASGMRTFALGIHLPVDDDSAELDRGTGRGVPGGDLLGSGTGVGHTCRLVLQQRPS